MKISYKASSIPKIRIPPKFDFTQFRKAGATERPHKSRKRRHRSLESKEGDKYSRPSYYDIEERHFQKPK